MNHPRISVDSAIMGGQPCIAGTRVPVYVLLNYLASGDTVEEVLEGYPFLTREDVQAALAYAAEALRPDEAIPA